MYLKTLYQLFFYGRNFIFLVSMHSSKMLPIKTYTTLHACPTKKRHPLHVRSLTIQFTQSYFS